MIADDEAFPLASDHRHPCLRRVPTEFALLVAEHQESLIAFLSYQLSDPELAVDVAQDALLDAFRNRDRLPTDCAFGAWLFGIARNHLRRHWRRQSLRHFISLDGLLAKGDGVHRALHQADGAARCHERDAIQQVLDHLSPILREALLLHDACGFTAPEIARIVGDLGAGGQAAR